MPPKKSSTQFVCAECGAKFSKWAGKCLECGAWSTLFEQEIEGETRGIGAKAMLLETGSKPVPISQVPTEHAKRLSTANVEFDRTLGGGMAPGSLVLIGGDPGIGKSTLVLQTLATIAAAGCKTLYVSGEESAAQVKLRAERLGVAGGDMLLLCETSLNKILENAKKIKPQVMVIDSIQTMYSEELPGTPGSVSQLRECALKLMIFAKSSGTVTMLIGHVTKDGQIAGPRILEHMVDTVAYFEGDKKGQYRILRTVKNRFGATDEIGVFEMTSLGLIPVQNPSRVFLQDGELSPGSAVSCTIEGSRALLFEIQALVGKSSYAMPQRVSAGVEQKKLTIILALLERFAKLQISNSDVFVSVAGGLRLDDPGIDLSLALAIVSNALNISLPPRSIVIGELGLSGEIRTVSSLDLRIKEAQRLGFEKIVVPSSGKIPVVKGVELFKFARLEEAVGWLH
ncbi:MAG: DNA repair protein RadA [Fibromonadaceae bacterium]|jgi:DNA repair protein RadA/Sms|nr:DNA repair protein RadA [Fibromonadaceae bacterium]